MLHGVMSSAAGWWRLAPDLANAGYEVVAPDLRGHGSSPAGPVMTLEAYRDDVLELGESWDLVLGHSLGGAIALQAIGVRPEWAAALILEDPALVMDDVAAAVGSLTAPWHEPIDRASVAAANPRWHRRDVDVKVDMLRQCGRDTVVRTIEDSVPYDLRPLRNAITMPTLLLGADPQHEGFVSPAFGASIELAHPTVEFAVVAGGSHSMHRDAYEELWPAISRFVAALPA